MREENTKEREKRLTRFVYPLSTKVDRTPCDTPISPLGGPLESAQAYAKGEKPNMADKKIFPREGRIVCPFCGATYLPAEVFSPGELEGKPDSIVKDALGTILYSDYVEGEEACPEEEYVCDVCGRRLRIKPRMTFEVEEAPEELDFARDSASLEG